MSAPAYVRIHCRCCHEDGFSLAPADPLLVHCLMTRCPNCGTQGHDVRSVWPIAWEQLPPDVREQMSAFGQAPRAA